MSKAFLGSCLIVVLSTLSQQASAQARFEPGFPPRHQRPMSQTLGAVYGSSDSCDIGQVAAIVRTDTDCDSLPNGRSSAWSIKVDGTCRNISDTTVEKACRAVKYDNARDVVYGSSDSCDPSTLEMVIDDYTDCSNLANGRNSAWSIKIDGVCRNISDTTVEKACLGVLTSNARNVVYGSSDSCDMSSVIAVVNRRTNCEMMPNAASWSIKVDGVCKNISDTTAVNACRAIKYTNAPNVVYGSSDSCDPATTILAVGPRTNCAALPNRGSSSWSVKINGVCKNISDTTVGQACLGVQAEMEMGDDGY